MLYMVADGNRRGVRHLLPDFWEHAADHGLPLPTVEPVTASAVCQARQRLSADVFRDLLYELSCAPINGKQVQGRCWRGRRVYAVDGAKINVRRSPDLEFAFGVPEGCYCPQLLMSTLVDVCARMPIDVEVSGCRESEREHLFRMLASIDPNSLLILDRGYPSHEVLQACALANIDFLVRVPSSHTFTAVDRFRLSGASDAIVTLDLPKDADFLWRPLQVRLTRIEGPDESAFYISSLLDQKDVSRADVAELYHMRWEVEEYFKLFTGEYIGQKQFRSTSAHGVTQEIAALTLFLAISSLLADAADCVSHDVDQFPSQKGAVLTLAKYLTRILLDPDRNAGQALLARAIKRIQLTRDHRRPNRSHPRRSFKPTPKWCPSGRRGA